MAGGERASYAELILAQQGLSPRAIRPVDIFGGNRVSLLREAGIPINFSTASEVFNTFRTQGNREGISTLHREGTGSRLLAGTTNVLFTEALAINASQERPKDPLHIFTAIV